MILFVYLQPKLIPILGNQQLPSLSLSLFPVDHAPSLKLLDFVCYVTRLGLLVGPNLI